MLTRFSLFRSQTRCAKMESWRTARRSIHRSIWCWGRITNPFSDPVELQVIALDKVVRAGADFVITQPVFDLDRFNVWMTLVRERGIHTRTCIIASVMPLTSAQQAIVLAQKFNHLDIRDEDVQTLESSSDQRAAGISLAARTAASLKNVEGVRGVHVVAGEDFELAAEVIKAGGLSRNRA